MKSVEQGAETSLYCATAPELADVTGRYYDNSREKSASAVATPELAAELWKRSEEFSKPDFVVAAHGHLTARAVVFFPSRNSRSRERQREIRLAIVPGGRSSAAPIVA